MVLNARGKAMLIVHDGNGRFKSSSHEKEVRRRVLTQGGTIYSDSTCTKTKDD